MTPSKLTPRKKVEEIIQSGEKVIRKKLFEGEVLSQQISSSYIEMKGTGSEIKKRRLCQVLRGNILKKYRQISTKRFLKSGRLNKMAGRVKNITVRENQRRITAFFEEDQNSRINPGKKDFITKDGLKHQIRFLEDDMKNLYEKFKEQNPSRRNDISYTTFTRYRPKWVRQMRVDQRETCMCIKCANMKMLVQALHKYKVIDSATPSDILAKVLCDKSNELCLLGKCKSCENKILPLNDFEQDAFGFYSKWQSVKETYQDKHSGSLKTVQKINKNKIEMTLSEICKELQRSIHVFAAHIGRVKHQHNALRSQKQNLKLNEAVVHIDFSENYQCKFAEETQGFHFGGSRKQVSLHTVVTYFHKSNDQSGQSSTVQSFCTLSECLRHDVHAIWAHLKPVLMSFPETVDTLHFWSDSPATQYRNKYMFTVLLKYFKKMFPNILHFTWNYHEAGHGKGAPDGVGGACKRIADTLVSQGNDIPNASSLICALKQRQKNQPKEQLKNKKSFETEERGLIIEEVGTKDVEEMEKLFHFIYVKPFKGTMIVHQVVSDPAGSSNLFMRELTCQKCTGDCPHYGCGMYTPDTKKLIVDEVYSASEDDNVITVVEDPGLSKKNINDITKDSVLKIQLQGRKEAFQYFAIVKEDPTKTGVIKLEYLTPCAKDKKLYKGNQNGVTYECSIDEVVDVLLDVKVVNKGKRQFYKLGE